MKQIIRLAALALLLMLLPGHAFAEPEAVEQAKSSVVQLYAMGYDGDGRLLSRWTGTAFAVGPAGEDSSVFLTNRHVAPAPPWPVKFSWPPAATPMWP